MRMLSIAILCAFAGIGCAGLRLTQPLKSASDDWTMQGGAPDRHHTAVTVPQLPLVRLWEYNAQGGILATPLVRDSIVIVATLHGELQAIDLRNGRRLGYEKLGAPITGTPALNGTIVYVPLSSANGSLVAFDLRENRIVWQAIAGPIESGVLLERTNVYVATLNGSVLSFDARTGEERWKASLGPQKDRKPIRSTPAYVAGVVVVGSDDGTLNGLNAADGTERWKVRMSASIFAGPVIAGEVAVVGDVRGEVVAVEIASGTVRWRHEAGGPIYGQSSSDGVSVYVPTAAGRILAIDAATGAERWSYEGSSVFNSAPLIAGDRLYIPSLDCTVAILDTKSGELIDRLTFDGRVKVSPVIWRGYVLVVSEDKFLSAFVHKGETP